MMRFSYLKVSVFFLSRKKLQMLKSQLKVDNMTLDLPTKGLYPTVKPTQEAGSYVVSKTHGLFLAVDEAKAAVLRAANFKVSF